MAESSFDASFNEDKYDFYSDREYEEFLTNIKRNLQLLDSKSNAKVENCFDVLGKDSTNVLADKACNDIAEISSTADAKIFDSNAAENFMPFLQGALDEDEKDSPFKPVDLSDGSTENSEEEENRFEMFLNQMNDRLETNTKTSQALHPCVSSLPFKSLSLSCETDSADQPIHARSQSTSRIPEFNLTEARAQAKHDFMSKRKFYAEQMYQFFNKKVFSNKLPETVLLKWNGQMKSTAGLCKCSRKNNEYSFHIELSPHVLTSFDRLQDTLIHEMCHAACWIVNHARDHHGQLWKTWADRCNLILPEVQVPTRCHSYELSYAYVLKCTSCVFERKRHKMCEKLQRTTCPICKAPTELKKGYK